MQSFQLLEVRMHRLPQGFALPLNEENRFQWWPAKNPEQQKKYIRKVGKTRKLPGWTPITILATKKSGHSCKTYPKTSSFHLSISILGTDGWLQTFRSWKRNMFFMLNLRWITDEQTVPLIMVCKYRDIKLLLWCVLVISSGAGFLQSTEYSYGQLQLK